MSIFELKFFKDSLFQITSIHLIIKMLIVLKELVDEKKC